MAVTLKDAKEYLRIDADIDDEDTLVTSLIDAANEYIEQCTGKQNDNSKLYDLCVKLLVAHWFENRAAIMTKPGAWGEMPHSVTALLTHISLAGHYPALPAEGGEGT